MNSPIEMLFVIVSHIQYKKVASVLEQNNISHHSVLMGKGTAESKLGDIFGFGIIDRDIVSAVIKKKESSKILNELNTALNLSEEHMGVAFTTEISAVTSDIFELLNIKVEELK